MITREQVADLRPGDVVEYSGHRDLHGAKVVGPLHLGRTGHLCVGDYVVRCEDGSPSVYRQADLTLTVVSRAPRPLYVNHDRAEPVPGDVVRDADSDGDKRTWVYYPIRIRYESKSLPWTQPADMTGLHEKRDRLPDRLLLLVDGETGRCVP